MKTNFYNTTNYSPSFNAKFTYSESLRDIARYAVEQGKFEKLNKARKNIEMSHLTTRLEVIAGLTEKDRPFVLFTRFLPKDGQVTHNLKDYKYAKEVFYESRKKGNFLEFALKKIIKMGTNAPENKIFQEVVVK